MDKKHIMTNTENQTRKIIIDKQLLVAGWDITDRTQVIEEFDIKVEISDSIAENIIEYNTHQFSDYVLLGKDGKPLAVIEAKKTSKDAETGREQAKGIRGIFTPSEINEILILTKELAAR